MKVKTTKRLVKKILNDELQDERHHIKLFDDELKKSLSEDIKTISLFLRKRQIKNWVNIDDKGDITFYRKYKFINDVSQFKYLIRLYVGRAIRYYYNRF